MVARKIIIFIAAMMIAISFVMPCALAEDSYEDEYHAMLDSLPDDVASLLPEKLFSGKSEDIVEGADEIVSFGYITNVTLEYLGLRLKSALKLLATLIGILLLAAMLNTVKTCFSSSAVSEAFSICSSCAVFLTAVVSQFSVISAVSEFFSRITVLVNSMIPLMGALYALGGNVAGAVVNHSSLMIFMTIIENLCAGTAMPVAGICMSFSAVSALAPGMGIGGIAGLFKKMYTYRPTGIDVHI